MDQGKFDDGAFFEAIESRRQAENLSWRQLGRKLALSPSTFSRMARGRRPDVDTFLRLLAWLNLPAESFIKGHARATSKGMDTLSAIRAVIRADRAIPSEGAGALEQLLRVVYARLATPHDRVTPPKGALSRSRRKS